MSDEKQSFVIYRNWMEMILALPDDTALDLTRTIFAYCLNRDYDPAPTAAAIFDTFEPLLERDIEKWYHTREERIRAGQLGGIANAKQKKANAKQMLPSAKQTVANGKQNEAVYVNVNDNVNVSVNDNVNDNVFPTESKKEGTNVPKKEIITALVAKWNSYADRGSIPTVRSVSVDSKTGKSVLARVEENGLDEVVEVMDMVFQSNYLRGFKNGWCAKFDWMFLPSNYEKILNGNYKDRDVVQTQNDMIDQWAAEYHAREGEMI